MSIDPKSLKKQETILDKDNKPVEIRDCYLNYLWNKQEKRNIQPIKTEKRVQTGEDGGQKCKETQEYELWDIEMGNYDILVYECDKKTSGWWYFGLGVLIVGAILLTGGGAAIVFGSLKVGAAIIAGVVVAGGGAGLGVGATIMVGIPDNYEKGSLKSHQKGVDLPTGNEKKIKDEKDIIKDWYPC